MKRLVALTTCIASAAAPASAAEKFPVPEDTGLYLGAGVYEESGRMLCGGFCFTYWEPGTLDPTGCVRLAAEEGFCNAGHMSRLFRRRFGAPPSAFRGR